MPGLVLNQIKECTEEMDAKGRSKERSRNKVEATGKALRHERRQQTGTQSDQGSCER